MAGQQVACPLCGGITAIASDLPPEASEPAAEAVPTPPDHASQAAVATGSPPLVPGGEQAEPAPAAGEASLPTVVSEASAVEPSSSLPPRPGGEPSHSSHGGPQQWTGERADGRQQVVEPNLAPVSYYQLGCPRCCGLFQVTEEMAETSVACPHCQAIVLVPKLPGNLTGPADQELSQDSAAKEDDQLIDCRGRHAEKNRGGQ